MNCNIISGNQTSFNLSPKPHQSSTTGSKLEPSPFISFNTHLRKPGFPIKNPSGSARKSRTNAAAVNTFAPPQTTESFYELLGISESGTLYEIKKAYKQLARKYHPDVSPADLTEEYTQRFILVQEAYETLADPQTRALYDRDLSRGIHLAFSARRRTDHDQRSEERGEWKNRWQSQLSELKRMSMNNDSRDSWGSRMRRERNESI